MRNTVIDLRNLLGQVDPSELTRQDVHALLGLAQQAANHLGID